MPRTSRGPVAITTLTLNPAIDVSFEIDRLEPIRKLHVQALRHDPGGGGVNVARVVRRLGGAAQAIFPAGGPTGERLKKMLEDEGTSFLAIPAARETREDFTVTDRDSGEQYRFVAPGERLSRTEWQASVRAARTASTPWIVASGSLPPGVPITLYGQLARHVRSKGAKLALDASGPALAHGDGAWLIKPNVSELQALVGRALPGVTERVAACRELLTRHACEIVALSMGAEGALLVSANGAWRAETPPTRVVSAVGAGDSFMGGLVYALASGRPEVEALRWAVAAGTAALSAPGTQLCHAAQARRLRALIAIASL